MRTITYRSVRREHVLKKHKGLSKTEIQIVRSATCSVFGLSIDAAGRKRADRPRRFFNARAGRPLLGFRRVAIGHRRDQFSLRVHSGFSKDRSELSGYGAQGCVPLLGDFLDCETFQYGVDDCVLGRCRIDRITQFREWNAQNENVLAPYTHPADAGSHIGFPLFG